MVQKFPDGSKCDMLVDADHKNACDLNKMISVLEDTKKVIRTNHVMGFNEPYDTKDPKKKQSPEQAAYLWAKWIQPAAEATNLGLVSCTTGYSSNKKRWTAGFIKACWDMRDDPDTPCDVDKIEAWSVHDYKCQQSRVDAELVDYAWHHDVADQVKALGAEGKDWRKFMTDRPIWVTEHNCNWDGDMPEANPDEQCARITGQREDTHGKGSVRVYTDSPAVDRFYWWNTWNPNKKQRHKTEISRLTEDDGELTAQGRAIVANLDPVEADCFGDF